jgi:PEP-CTERM motif
MKVFKALSSAMLCGAVLVALSAKANAAVIPVANPDFSLFAAGQSAATYMNFGCGTGCAFDDNVTVGWMQSVTRSASADAGQWLIGPVPSTNNTFNADPMIGGTTPEPIVMRGVNASIWQTVIPTAQQGVAYTLDADLGFEHFAPDRGQLFLVVGSDQTKATPLASYGMTQTQMQGSGNWYDFEASFTATMADVDDPIEILFVSNTTPGDGFGFFGDVRLTDSLAAGNPMAAPEPATWAMLLVGFAGLGFAGYRRARQPRAA